MYFPISLNMGDVKEGWLEALNLLESMKRQIEANEEERKNEK